ncbi:MAG: hypothetical protein MHPSP_001499 [Paramarteilia canceri]
MCNRTVSGFSKGGLVRRCSRQLETEKIHLDPSFKDNYAQNFNCTPGSDLPMIISGEKYRKNTGKILEEDSDYAIMMMKWAFSLNGNSQAITNARYETATEKKMFSKSIRDGNRALLVISGYYEWKAENKIKQPYLFYNKNFTEGSKEDYDDGIDANALFLACIFKKENNIDNPLAFTILTRDASEQVKFCHHRMPLIFNDKEAALQWLNACPNTSFGSLVAKTEIPNINFHKVSTLVNKSSNKGYECIQEIKEEIKQETEPPKKKTTNVEITNFAKKIKMEPVD